MGQIPAAFIEDLVCRTDLAALVSERVQLKKGGNTYKGCCPFHDEKTPSFYVYNEDQPPQYHCFGCGAHGDAIDYLKDLEHQSFSDAVESLCKRLGLEVPRDEAAQQAADRLKPLLDTLAFAEQQYRQALHQHPQSAIAKDYLKQRDISTEMVDLFGLGFAPGGRQFLTQNADPIRLKACVELRLVLDKTGKKSDLFQNRLMFPIRDSRGRTVAFAGRTLTNDRSKYINSTESPVFHKSTLLYGLWEARKQNRKLQQLIVVEGYLDVISLAQFGISNAVAAMGTATNEQNLSHILTTSPNILFCFDGDKAGVAAAEKALLNLLPLLEDGHKISFLLLPEGDDPDSLVRQEGAARFRDRVAAATPLSEYFFNALGADLNLQLPEDKGVLSNRCRDALQQVNARVLKDGLYQRLRELTRSPKWEKHQGKWTKQREQLVPEERVPVPNRTVAKVCLGLYQQPLWAKEISHILSYEITDNDETALPIFLQWIMDANIDSSEELLYQLATDKHSRHRFGHLFNELEHTFSEEANQEEARDMLKVLKEKYLSLNFEIIEKAIIADPTNTAVQEKYRAITRELNDLRGSTQ